MRAIVVADPGGPEALVPREIAEPVPGAGEVTIDVAYAGLNFAEVLARRGALGPLPERFVPGLEVSGHVRAVGAGVEQLATGQPVCAYVGTGAYAEVVVAPAHQVFVVGWDRPAALLTAAALPTVGITAWSVLHDAARLQAGETVLVHAAAGGLGTVLGQVARQLGAGRVIGTVRDEAKAAFARRFGYDEVVHRDHFAQRVAELTAGRGVNVVVDTVGGAVRRRSLEALAPYGRLIVCGNASGDDDDSPSGARLMHRNVSIGGFGIGGLAARASERFGDVGRTVVDLVGRGVLCIEVTEVVELSDIRSAHRRLEAGATHGKRVIRVGVAPDAPPPSSTTS